jgi:hypothetical protein
MLSKEKYYGVKDKMTASLSSKDKYTGPKGTFYGFIGPVIDSPSLEKLKSSSEHIPVLEKHNLIVKDMSILLARLIKDNQEAPFGAYVLAVGSGDTGWNVMSPPAATDSQRALYNEIERKTFATTQFIDDGGSQVAYPTNIVDFITTFTESEAVGPLVEMGLLGGNISTNLAIKNPVPAGTYDATVDLTAYETMINYLTFPVINKPATASLTWVWRLTF